MNMSLEYLYCIYHIQGYYRCCLNVLDDKTGFDIDYMYYALRYPQHYISTFNILLNRFEEVVIIKIYVTG